MRLPCFARPSAKYEPEDHAKLAGARDAAPVEARSKGKEAGGNGHVPSPALSPAPSPGTTRKQPSPEVAHHLSKLQSTMTNVDEALRHAAQPGVAASPPGSGPRSSQQGQDGPRSISGPGTEPSAAVAPPALKAATPGIQECMSATSSGVSHQVVHAIDNVPPGAPSASTVRTDRFSPGATGSSHRTLDPGSQVPDLDAMSDLSDPGEYEHYGGESQDEEEEGVLCDPEVTAADFEEAARVATTAIQRDIVGTLSAPAAPASHNGAPGTSPTKRLSGNGTPRRGPGGLQSNATVGTAQVNSINAAVSLAYDLAITNSFTSHKVSHRDTSVGARQSMLEAAAAALQGSPAAQSAPSSAVPNSKFVVAPSSARSTGPATPGGSTPAAPASATRAADSHTLAAAARAGPRSSTPSSLPWSTGVGGEVIEMEDDTPTICAQRNTPQRATREEDPPLPSTPPAADGVTPRSKAAPASAPAALPRTRSPRTAGADSVPNTAASRLPTPPSVAETSGSAPASTERKSPRGGAQTAASTSLSRSPSGSGAAPARSSSGSYRQSTAASRNGRSGQAGAQATSGAWSKSLRDPLAASSGARPRTDSNRQGSPGTAGGQAAAKPPSARPASARELAAGHGSDDVARTHPGARPPPRAKSAVSIARMGSTTTSPAASTARGTSNGISRTPSATPTGIRRAASGTLGGDKRGGAASKGAARGAAAAADTARSASYSGVRPAAPAIPPMFCPEAGCELPIAAWRLVRLAKNVSCDAANGTALQETVDGTSELFQCDQELAAGQLAVVCVHTVAGKMEPKLWCFCPDPLCMGSKPKGSALTKWPTRVVLGPGTKVTRSEYADLKALGMDIAAPSASASPANKGPAPDNASPTATLAAR